MSTPQRTDYVLGDFDPTDFAAAYSCGHCHADVVLGTTDAGITQVAVHHDPGCPVLVGALSAMPDALRAVVPHTFRP